MTELLNKQPHLASARSPKWRLRPAWLLATLVLLTFGRICAHGFTNWDDDYTISQNPDFNPPTLVSVMRSWHESQLALYIPVTYMVWGGLAFLSGIGAARNVTPNPWLFHTASVLVHLLAALVVFATLRRLAKNRWAAFVGAGIFALHPVQVEAVAWASGMKDLLCGLFSLIAIWQYVRYVEESKRSAYLLGTLALIAGVLSKPTAMMTPVLALIVDHWLLGRSWRENFKSLWLWFVLIVPFAIVARMVQGVMGTPLTPWWTRPLIYTDAMAFYMLKLVWPVHLAIDYARSPVRAMHQGWIYWTWIFPVLAAGAIILFRRRRWLVAGVLLFLAGWLPVSGLTGFLFQFYSTVADHYLYLSMFGIAVIAAYVVKAYPRWTWIYAAIVALLALGSFVQAGYWGSSTTLYRHVLSVSPRSYMARNNLAMILLSENHPAEAQQLLEQATQINPEHYQAWEQLAELLVQRGEIDGAIDAEKHAMATRELLPSRGGPSYPAQLDLFGQLLLSRHRYSEAIEQFKHALRINPSYAPARKHLLEAERGPTTR
ncbi:MAG TPA: tetratricopeptide repeat protein [Tepidisphaeraceae bacterium]|nr:tetratricopeptide repeat protein [Tepidisphaeraceae bacterium]